MNFFKCEKKKLFLITSLKISLKTTLIKTHEQECFSRADTGWKAGNLGTYICLMNEHLPHLWNGHLVQSLLPLSW